ncbi:MAG: hypothetical protein ACR2LS_04220 [Thermomicrobiales bacterium]
MSTTKLPDDEDRPKRSRLEDEVLEILQKNDRPISFTDHVRRKAAQQRQTAPKPSLGLRHHRLWPLAPFIGAFVVAFVGLSIRDTSALLATILAWVSVGMFFLPLVLHFRRPSQAHVKRWRGRDLDFREPRRDWWQELRDRISGKPRI